MSLSTALHDNRPTWHNPRILLVLLCVFLGGAATGALAMRYAGKARPAAAASYSEGGRALSIGMLKKELDLTPEQTAEIETVLDDFVMYYQNLQGQMDDFRSDGKARIVRVLRPEQREKFQKLMADMQAKLR